MHTGRHASRFHKNGDIEMCFIFEMSEIFEQDAKMASYFPPKIIFKFSKSTEVEKRVFSTFFEKIFHLSLIFNLRLFEIV